MTSCCSSVATLSASSANWSSLCDVYNSTEFYCVFLVGQLTDVNNVLA